MCVVAIALAWRTMPTRTSPSAGRLDVLGLLLLSPACAVVVFGLTEAGKYGSFGDRHVVIPLAIGFVLLAAFSIHALRTENPMGFAAVSVLLAVLMPARSPQQHSKGEASVPIL
ncbi:hypothetical protein [Embleya sp. NBC_00896]|uniref:hypothetical protein n=1 Tax=Embleya sp. NBC_00896 TaxID=2975961 RepID=UPI002F918B26|nr:hypothetical protein OG928_39565 [Embleya sp. NBC_00896]